MRNMSFMLTEPQFLDGSKTVTRRLGWAFLKPGDRVRAVRKAMGLPKGGHVEPLGIIEIVSVRRERLNEITYEEVQREGFPGKTAFWFVRFFCTNMKVESGRLITRIEFFRVEPDTEGGE